MESLARQEEELIEEFRAIDTDGDGQLSREEYLQAFEAAWAESEEAADEEFQTRMREFALMEFDSLDLDGNGRIDVEEFLLARTETQAVSDDYLAFLTLDQDGNGVLSLHELLPDPVDEPAGSPLGREHLGRVSALQRFDLDGDGKVSLDEWLAARREERARYREARKPATW